MTKNRSPELITKKRNQKPKMKFLQLENTLTRPKLLVNVFFILTRFGRKIENKLLQRKYASIRLKFERPVLIRLNV